jgi:predicted AlkP superfamily phosphohydrolase/phosphomutase
VIACVFETTDSIQHMFFRYLDPTHPALKTGQAKMSEQVIEDLYRKMDDFVGRVRAELDDKSVVLVMSDHGFKPFRRGVNVNTWLLENGYLALVEGKRESGEWFRDVDWDRTKAYGLGLGGIYVNQKGREARGIVASGAEARALKKEISSKLAALVDPENGRKPVNEVYDQDDVFVGPYRDNAPDMVVGYDAGYRASWDSVKGMVGSPVLSDNTKAWSGDHCIDAKVVPGVLFSSRKLNTREPRIWDIAPTALALFGLEAPGHMDGRCLVSADVPPAAKERRGK